MLTTFLRRAVHPLLVIALVLLGNSRLFGGGKPIVVTVSPATATLRTGELKQFTATVTGTTNTAVNWAISGGLTIDGAGWVSPTWTPGTYIVTATSQATPTKSGSATLTVSNAISVQLYGGTASAYPGDTVRLRAEVLGGSSPTGAVAWSQSAGTLTPLSNPLYADYQVPSTPGTYTVTATSVEDPSKFSITSIVVLDPSVVTFSTYTTVNPISGPPLYGIQIYVTLRGGSTGIAEWSATGGSLDRLETIGSTSQTYRLPGLPGSYQITVKPKDDPSKAVILSVTVVQATTPTIHGIEVKNPVILAGGSAQIVPYFSAAGSTATLSPTIGAVSTGTSYRVQPTTLTKYLLTLKVSSRTSYTGLSDWVAPGIAAQLRPDTALKSATAYDERLDSQSLVIRPDGKIAVAGSGYVSPECYYLLGNGGQPDKGSFPVPDERIFDPETGSTITNQGVFRAKQASLMAADGRVQYFGGTLRDGIKEDSTVAEHGGLVSMSQGYRNRYSGARVLQGIDGKAVLIGGVGAFTKWANAEHTSYYISPWVGPSDWVEVRDPVSGTTEFIRTQFKREGGSAVLLKDGRIFLAGGIESPYEYPEVLNLATKTAVLPAGLKGFYDARNGISLSRARAAGLMVDGKVLILENVLSTGEGWIGIWDPVSDVYSRKVQVPSWSGTAFVADPIGNELYPIGFTTRDDSQYGSHALFYDAIRNAVIATEDLRIPSGKGWIGSARWFGMTAQGDCLIDLSYSTGSPNSYVVREPWRVSLGLPFTTFPSALSIPLRGVFKFSARTGQNESINWSILEGTSGGTVASDGTYTAPDMPGIYHVVATSPSGRSVSTIKVIPSLPLVNRLSLDKASAPVGGVVSVDWDVRWADSLHLQTRDANGVVLDDLNVTGQIGAVVTVKPGAARFTLVATNGFGSVESSQYFTLWSVNAVTISPAGTSYMIPGGTFKFAASVSGTNGTPTTVIWTPLDGGSTDSDGTYHAPAVAGTYHLQAASSFDSTKSAQVTIVVGYAVNSVRINPTGTTYLNPGQSKPFSVVVSVVPGTPNSVIWTTPDGGNVDGNGLFTAPAQSGTFRLRATSTYDGTKVDTVTVIVGTSATLSSFSANPSIVSPGKSALLSWTSQGASTKTLTTPVDEFGNGGETWNVTNYSQGFNATPSKTTTYTLNVSNPFGGESKSVTVTVSPVTELSITPTNATAYVGSTKAFGASITSTGSTAVTWSTDDPGGSISGTGLSAIYTPGGTPGTYHVTVTSVLDAARKATAEVTVIRPVVTLSITPGDTGLVTGQSLSFGSTIEVTGSTNASLVWTCSGGRLLAKGAASFYTAPLTPGTYTVTATSVANPEVSATATIQVATPSTPASYLFAMPSAATLRIGQRLFIGVSYGSPDPSAGLNWASSGGSLAVDASTSSAFFSAATEGNYTVSIASRFDPTLTAQVTVTVVPLEGWTVTPSALTLATGQASFFEAAEASGMIIPNAVWSLQEAPAGGSVTLSGQYFAPTTAGTYHVIATNPANPAQTATATITVVAGGGGGGNGGGTTPTNQGVTVAPETSNVPAGTYQSLSAVVSGMDDQSVTWAVENRPLTASVDASGVFTANQPGTYRVFATSTANPALNGSAVLSVVSSVTAIPTAPVNLTLRGYTVTALNDGRILISGGTDGTTYFASARLYDPETKTFSDTPAMLTPRAYHTATLLKDGRVLLAGGVGLPDPVLGGISNDSSGEVFNPVTNAFEALPPRPTPNGGSLAGYMRSAHATSKWSDALETDGHGQSVATVLGNGQVLIAGGPMVTGSWNGGPVTELGSLSYYRVSEVFDAATNLFDLSNPFTDVFSWAEGPNSILTRKGTQVVTLDDGTALMTGGLIKPILGGGPCGAQVNGYGACALSEVRVFNGSAFLTLATMKEPRAYHTMTKLPDGKILIVGGYKAINLEGTFGPSNSSGYHPVSTATAEVYDPATGVFTLVGSLQEARARHAAILLPTGKVMIVGGKAEYGDGSYSWPKTTELYDPETGVFSVMDHLEYGVEEPKVVIAGSNKLFLTGVPQGFTPPSAKIQGAFLAATGPTSGLTMFSLLDLGGPTGRLMEVTWGGDVPVSLNQQVVELPHWSSGLALVDGVGSKRPAMLLLGSIVPALQVKISVNAEKYFPGTSKLVGTLPAILRPPYAVLEPLKLEGNVQLQGGTQTVTVNITKSPLGVAGYRGDVVWKLVSREGEEVALTGPTRLEVFFGFEKPMNSIWGEDGVWAEALRLLFDRSSAAQTTTREAALTEITRYLHWDHKLRYDTDHGGSRFGFNLENNGASLLNDNGGMFDLASYIKSKSSYSLNYANCLDQAAGVQTLASAIGIKVEWHYLTPYGFISTHLLGITGECNSPVKYLDSGAGHAECEGQPWIQYFSNILSPCRTYFSGHSYVIFNGKVFDATAGPHLGSNSEQDYLRNSIDPNPGLYMPLNPRGIPFPDFNAITLSKTGVIGVSR